MLGIAGRLAYFGKLHHHHRPDTDHAGRSWTGDATWSPTWRRSPRPGTRAPGRRRRRRIGAARILTVGRMIDDINRVGMGRGPRPAAGRPPRRSHGCRARCRATCRADADRRLTAALRESDNRRRADALLLARATGVRIGELIDLELDCVHEVPGAGAWLKVPLGKLDTERMVPLDPETVELIDRIVQHRFPGRPVRNTRTGRLAVPARPPGAAGSPRTCSVTS